MTPKLNLTVFEHVLKVSAKKKEEIVWKRNIDLQASNDNYLYNNNKRLVENQLIQRNHQKVDFHKLWNKNILKTTKWR